MVVIWSNSEGRKAERTGFYQNTFFTTTNFHLRLSLKCSWGSGGHCKLWLNQHSNRLKPLYMALFFGCDKWYSYCIITSNPCSHILLKSWENPIQSSLLFTRLHWHVSTLQHHTTFDWFSYQNYVSQTIGAKFSENLLKYERHAAKLAPIFPTNVL